MLRTVLLTLLLVALPLLAQAKPGGLLKYGMALEEAEQVLADEASWRIAYRVDTPSTAEIAAQWQDSVFYLARFYDGRCYSLEKRAQVQRAEVDALIELYIQTYGTTPDASQDRDGRLIYARWNRSEREVSIYATRGEGETYKLMYEEADPVVRSSARRTQEQELATLPRETDPLTGRIRVNPLGASAQGPADPNAPEEEPAEDDAGSEGEDAEPEAGDEGANESAAPEDADGLEDAEAAEDAEADPDEAEPADTDAPDDSDEQPSPRPRRSSPDEW